MNDILQRELDVLAPVCAAWEHRERAFVFVRCADDENLNVAMWEWRAAQSELVDARIAHARAELDVAGAPLPFVAPKYSDFDRSLMALAVLWAAGSLALAVAVGKLIAGGAR